MALDAGTLLGPYEITELIGSGGMGEVYRARDTRLDRTVAIKVAAAQFSARFEREARAVAALNHPNICALYDVGPDYLVMEYVDGRTLNRVIPPAGMRLADALKTAVRIADALAAAHAAGIVHRDLKPGNVMVTEAGVVKLLDFGLATHDETAAFTDSQVTRTVHAGPKTVEGTIVGTFAYMSPEQAEGRKLDGRSDIFSFGSVLYEMLTGRRAFRGETTVSTLAAILNKEPTSPAEIQAGLPREVERIVLRCLRKDPDRRFQHASDLRVELQEVLDAQSAAGAPPEKPKPRPSRPRAWIWPAVAALALAAGLAAGWFLHRPPPPFAGPQLTRATWDSGLTCDPALSSDGKLLAYASDRGEAGTLAIWVQPAAGGDPVRLTHDQADDSAPSFSPDSSQIVYRSERDGGGVYVISALGGEPRLLAREGRNPRFSPDGSQIAYWTGKGGRNEAFARQAGRIFVVPAGGGEPRQIAAGVPYASTPVWSPDGRRLLFVGLTGRSGARNYTWLVTSLADDTPVAIQGNEVPVPTPSAWLAGDRIVYAGRRGASANLYRVRLDAGAGKLGQPEQLTFGGGVLDSPSVDAKGQAALADLSWNYDLWLLPIEANQARVTGAPVRLTDTLAAEAYPSLSDDGRKLVYASVRGTQGDVVLRDLGSGKSTRIFSFPIGGTTNPWISHDGSTVAYSRKKDPILLLYTVPAAGGLARRLSDEDRGFIMGWTPSGGIVHFVGAGRSHGTGRVAVMDAKTLQSRMLLDVKFTPYQTVFSPDGKWISFLRMPTMQNAAIMIAPATGPWPIPEDKFIPITDGTGWDDKPRWSPDGNLLYFTSERDGYRCLWAQRLEPQTRKPAGAPFAVYHSHSSRRSMFNVGLTPLEVALGPDKAVFVQGEVTGNIWIAQFQ